MAIVYWIGAALAAASGWFMWREHRAILESRVVEGRVLELVAGRDTDGGTTYVPKVAFRDRGGREFVFSPLMASSHPGLKAGDAVRVAYREEEPQKARLLRFAYRYGVWYAVLGVGLFLMFVGYGFRRGDAWLERAYAPLDAGPR